MSKSTKENILGLVAIVVLVILMVCVVIRDIDKDVERECGKKWDDNGSELCKEFWEAKGIKANADANAPIVSTRN